MALAKDRTPHNSHIGLVQPSTYYENVVGVGSSHQFSHLSSPPIFEEANETSEKPGQLNPLNFLTASRSSSLSSNYQPEETHSVINFKSGYESFEHTGGSLLSFEQNECSILDQNQLSAPRGITNVRLMENFNCIQTATTNYGSTVRENYHVEEPFGWPNLEATEAIDELGTQESCFLKRPHMSQGESMQALKKQCTSATKKPKPKSTQSKDPQSIAAKNRRERISERLKILQDLVPNGSKVDLVTMLEKAISYVKFLQLQVKVLATDELWPGQGGKAPELSQVKDAIDAILASHKDRNSSSK